MSIKNTMLYLKSIKNLCLVFFLLSFVLIPSESRSWYIEKKNNDFFFSECQLIKKDSPARSYVMFFDSDKERCSGIHPVACGEKLLVAGRVNIDIPVTLMVKESVSPTSDLDRLIAVNLSLKKLVTELEEMEERSRKLMADLSVPYLKRTESLSKKQIHEMRKVYLKRGEWREKVESSTKYSSFIFSKKDTGGSELRVGQKNYTTSGFKGKFGTGGKSGLQKESREFSLSVDRTKEKSLPWGFRLVLSSFKYVVLHKYEFVFAGLSFVFLLFFVISRLKNV